MRKVFFGLLVAATAIGGSVATYAGTLFHSSGKTVTQWYRFNGGLESNQNNYTATVSLPEECNGSNVLCAILAPEDANNPGHPIVADQTDSAYKP